MSLTCPATRPPICPHRVPTFQMAPATNHIISHQSPRFPYQRLDLFHQPHHIQSSVMNDTHMQCTLGSDERVSWLSAAEIQFYFEYIFYINQSFSQKQCGCKSSVYILVWADKVPAKYLKSLMQKHPVNPLLLGWDWQSSRGFSLWGWVARH